MKKFIFALSLLGSVSAQAADLSLDLSGLEDLGPTATYEGWLIVNGSPVSTGTFSVDSSGNPGMTNFVVDDMDADNASLFVLTIEPVPDADPGPASTHILAGEFNAGMASITVDHPAALGDDFTASTGSFILAAPSDLNMAGTYKNGIWFLTMPTPDPGLALPTLPAGWAYEGWVVDTSVGTPISTGTFLTVTGADSDAGGPTAGPGDTPPFPGQDFVNPLRDLTTSHMAVISVEPVPDNSPMPFTLKPLVAMPITDPGAGGISQPMANNAQGTNPSGLASFSSASGGSSTQAIPSLGVYGIFLLLLSVALISRRELIKRKF